jgi:hypothetical protein
MVLDLWMWRGPELNWALRVYLAVGPEMNLGFSSFFYDFPKMPLAHFLSSLYSFWPVGFLVILFLPP